MLPLTPENRAVIRAWAGAGGGSMHAQNAAWRILRQLIDGTPQARDVEITLVEPDHQEVRFLLAQKVNDAFDWPPVDQMAAQFDAVTLRLGSCLVLKFFVKFQPV